MSARWVLAQANVARRRAPLEDPRLEGFRAQLERINALADRSPGFVRRLQSEQGDATAIRAYDDPLPAGQVPAVAEGVAKLALLHDLGPTHAALPFPAPGAPPREPPEVDAEFCASPAV